MEELKREIAKKKLQLGRARKVLWQYRNEDLNDEIVADSITHLEECVKDVIKKQIMGCSVEVEDAIESQKEEGREVPQGLKGQLHAFNKCLRILS